MDDLDIHSNRCISTGFLLTIVAPNDTYPSDPNLHGKSLPLREARNMVSSRRKIGAGILIVAGLVALIIPFLFAPNVQHATTPPPPPGGNNHGGGGGTTPPCTMNCAASTDNEPPQTTIQLTGRLSWPRNDVHYYYPNFTITLHAVDDENLSSIILNDTGYVSTFHVHGLASTEQTTITVNGLHKLSYYSIDQAGNKETAHQSIVGLSKPDLSDLKNLIANSGVDNTGIKNALAVKVETAQDQLARNQPPNALNALAKQLAALEEKHGLIHAQVDQMLMIISAITGK